VADGSIEDRTTATVLAGERHRVTSPGDLEGFWREVVYRHLVEQFSVETSEATERRVAQPHRAADDSVEHRLDVGG
jgi:hypothetical protein